MNNSEENLNEYAALGMAIIQQAYDDLVESYKMILSLTYPIHGRNTLNVWTHKKNKVKVLLKAKHMRTECLYFFMSNGYDTYRLNLDIEGTDIIKQAQRKALEWFRDRDEKSLKRNAKELKKATKKAIARHKRKEQKRGRI